MVDAHMKKGSERFDLGRLEVQVDARAPLRGGRAG